MRAFKAFIWLIILAVLAGGGLYFWHMKKGAETAAVKPQRRDVIEAVYATGEVEPLSWLQVAPQLTAQFEEILVDDGDRVEKGQLLAKADTSVEQAKLEEFEAHLTQMKSEYERNKGLLDKGYISQKAFDEAISAWNELQSRIENQRLLIARMSLSAPVSGTVLRRDIEPGEVKTPGQTVFWLGDPGDLRITAEVDEEDILRVKSGQTALLKADAVEGTVLEGTVAGITPKGDPVNKNFRVRIALEKGGPLQTGMTVEINIVTAKSESALTVPADAVRDGAVWVFAGTGWKKTPVATGRADGRFVEILSGLSGGETVMAVAP